MSGKLNAEELLDQLIRSGRDWLSRGSDAVGREQQLPNSPEVRDRTLRSAGLGALAGGALALLVGTRRGRKLGKTAIKLGGLAALGGLAYQVYNDWREREGAEQVPERALGTPVAELADADVDRRARLLLRALVAAAYAEGHMTQRERAQIQAHLDAMGANAELETFLALELKNPANPDLIGTLVESTAEASEVYLLSAALVDPSFAADRAYLDRLAHALRLPPRLAARLEVQQQLADV